jgi:Cyclopropane fatty acid synthase and related methyltransferases
MAAPNKSSEFDKVYSSSIKHWIWSDIRIPKEIKALAQLGSPQNALELGCGLGRFSRYVAQLGVHVTGIDFSPVAVAKAQAMAAHYDIQPAFQVGDVTHLDALKGPFDISFDVGCFHCLNPDGQRAYASEVCRLLKLRGTHLIWALDSAPSDIRLSPTVIKEIFSTGFELQSFRKSRRRIASSHWYWLVR